MPSYKEHEVWISEGQKKKLQVAIKRGTSITIKLTSRAVGAGEKATLLLTKQQIADLEKKKKKKGIYYIRMSKRQLHANTTFEGGFLGMLAALAARVLPTLLTGLASGLVSGAVEKAVSGSGLYLRRGKHCYRADPVEGNGLFLSRQRHGAIPITLGNGTFLKRGKKDVSKIRGRGLLFGPNSPFSKIPILGWIL